MSEHIVELTEANWDSEVAQSKVPVLVDFWGPSCMPCRMLEPTLEAVAKEYVGQVKVGKVNCDDNAALVERFGVRGIPHLILLRGEQAALVVQGRTRSRIANEIEGNLA